MLRRFLLALIVVVGLPAALLVGAPVASAHDRLVSSNPAENSTVAPPAQITLTFNEGVADVGAVIVVKGNNEEWQNGIPSVKGTVVTQALRPMPGGDYTVAWRITSADGHPVSGQFSFTATPPVTTSTSTATSATGPVTLPSASTSPGLPTQRKPTDATDNAPWLIAGGALLALIVIGVLLALGRKNLKDDEPAS